MATAIEYGLIAAGISLGIVAVVQNASTTKSSYDPVKARYEWIEHECAKPNADGSRRDKVYIANSPFAQGQDYKEHTYVPCL